MTSVFFQGHSSLGTRFARLFLRGVLVLVLLVSGPALAQQATFLPQDAALLQSCIQKVRDTANASVMTNSDCIGAAQKVCLAAPDSQTTLGITECNFREESWWDGQLNIYYASLRKSLLPDVFEVLRDAQRAWLIYRDANCAFDYKIFEDGTIRHILFSSCRLQMTAQRAIDLISIQEDWVNL